MKFFVLLALCVAANAYINLSDRPAWESSIDDAQADYGELLKFYQSINMTQREVTNLMREFDYEDAAIPKGKAEYSYWEVRQHLQSIPLPWQFVDGEATARVPPGGWIPMCKCIGLKKNHYSCSPLGITMFKPASNAANFASRHDTCVFEGCNFPQLGTDGQYLPGTDSDTDSDNEPPFSPGHAYTGGNNEWNGSNGHANKFLGSWCTISAADYPDSECSTEYAADNCGDLFDYDKGSCRWTGGLDCDWCTQCGACTSGPADACL